MTPREGMRDRYYPKIGDEGRGVPSSQAKEGLLQFHLDPKDPSPALNLNTGYRSLALPN